MTAPSSSLAALTGSSNISCRTWALVREPLVFLVTDIAGLIDEQHWNSVLNAISLAQPGVVEHAIDQDQRTSVGGAYQDAQQFRINHVRIEQSHGY